LSSTAIAEPPLYRYRLFGLTLESEWELPQLPTAGRGIPDVRIVRRDALADSPAEGSQCPLDVTILRIPAVATYRISHGKRIEVCPEPAVSGRNIRLYLLGSALGALLHQRSRLALHANAVDLGGVAVIFMGHSGAGKSTLAAWFHDHNYPILADDICPVEVIDGSPLVYPGIPRLRLWREAVEYFNRSVADYEMSFDDYEKYDVPTTVINGGEALPLVAAYELFRDDTISSPVFHQLRGVDSVDALVANTYRGELIAGSSAIHNHVRQCIELAGTVPIFRVRRPWGLSVFDKVNEALAAHAQHLGERFGGTSQNGVTGTETNGASAVIRKCL
jgi:hypothetical protein